VPEVITGGKHAPEEFRTVDHFIEHGTRLPQLDELKWEKGQGARQIAFLCYSSGTSGLPKGVMIAHRNVIANTMQYKYFEKPYRDKGVKLGQPGPTMTVLGLLPFSHIYGLIIIAHASAFRGDSVVVLPKFEFSTMLQAVERFKVQILYLVPPIVVLMSKSKQIMEKYNLDSVQGVFTGAAPLGEETTLDIIKHWPKWSVRQGYGLTETSTVVCATHPDDIVHGSSGSLVPSVEVRLVDPEGNDINEYDKEGELWVKSPSVVRGYLNNEKATKETFEDGYMKTGDVAIIRKSPLGHEHIFIIDRIKELIKVNAFQVAPAELEAHLLTHPAVNDCAVIQVPHDRTGEAPKAYVVKSLSTGAVESDEAIAKQIEDHVRRAKSKHKWLTGGVEFIDVIPKSPSGKILRRLLRDKDKADRRKKGARL
jgi:ribosome assembly protein SQT1